MSEAVLVPFLVFIGFSVLLVIGTICTMTIMAFAKYLEKDK